MPSYANAAPQASYNVLSRTFAYRPLARFTGLLLPAFFQHHADRHQVAFARRPQDSFSDALTLWAWLSQVLSASKSCLAATARVVALTCSLGWKVPSAATGAYCKARRKLPVPFLQDLTTALGQQLEGRALEPWKWQGRHVKLVDGSVVLLPDSPANLQQFPQQRSQKPGTSYACMRLVVLLGLATAALLGAACGPYRGLGSGEMSLFASLLAQLEAGDIVLGDRYYGSYALLASLLGRQVDGCFRLPESRSAEFGTGQRLGEDDYLHVWTKPEHRPKWLAKEVWDTLPTTLTVRLLRFRISQRGFRSRQIDLVTTLLDPQRYSRAELAQLYRERWHVELDIRSLKQSLKIKLLRCKTPEMVRAELWVHLLGYNLVRCVSAQAAADTGLLARQVSFKGAVQTLDAFGALLSGQPGDDEGAVSAETAAALTAALAVHRVGQRPDRWEPREIKHRQRKYPELRKSRQERKAELLEAGPQERTKGRGKGRPSGRQR
jgi:hypothetical protein